MPRVDQESRLAAAAMAAKQAEGCGEEVLAATEWRRYRLIADSARDPEDLLVEGIALSVAAVTLIEPAP